MTKIIRIDGLTNIPLDNITDKVNTPKTSKASFSKTSFQGDLKTYAIDS